MRTLFLGGWDIILGGVNAGVWGIIWLGGGEWENILVEWGWVEMSGGGCTV